MKSEALTKAQRHRRFMILGGWVMAGVSALNWLLFRWDGIDLLFWGGVVLALYVLVSTRFAKPLPGLDAIVLIAMTPWLIFAAILGYFMLLGTWAYYTARPVPEHLVRQRPPVEDLAALEEVLRRFPKEPVPEIEEARDRLENIRRDLQWRHPKFHDDKSFARTAWITWEQAFADPDVLGDIAIVSPYLNEYYSFYETRSPARAEINYTIIEPESYARGRNGETELIVIRYLAMSPTTVEEARMRYERILRGSLRQFEGSLTGPGFLTEISQASNCLGFLEKAPAAFYSPQSAARQLDLISKLRPSLELGFKSALRAELHSYHVLIRQHINFTEQIRTFPGCEVTIQPDVTRLTYWPFTVENYGLARHAQIYDRFYQACELPTPEAWRLLQKGEDERPGPWEVLLGPSPNTSILTGIFHVESNPFWRNFKSLESRLAAYEHALRWKTGASALPAPIDPMTELAFHVQELPDRLVIAGGNPKIRHPHPKDEELLANYGISGQYLYLIDLPRQP